MLKASMAIAISLAVCSIESFADKNDTSQSEFTVGAASLSWTVDDMFHGQKLLLSGKYILDLDESEETQPVSNHTLHFNWQVGDNDKKTEHYLVGYLFGAEQTDYEITPGKFQTVRDQLSYGGALVSNDETLGVDYNHELLFAKFGRTWAYTLENDISFGVMLAGSLGWSWASSYNPNYQSVNNPTVGTWQEYYVDFNRWGRLYGKMMQINGYTIAEPKQMTTRRGLAGAGYRVYLSDDLFISAVLEKRTFLFAGFDIRDIYTKARRFSLNLGHYF